MKLYEIHEAVRALEEQIVVDPETGEFLCDMDTIEAQLHNLQQEWGNVMEWVAKVVLNTLAEEAALKAEEDRLKKRREALGRKEDRLMKVLERECGQTTKLGVATLTFRKTTKLDVSDEAAAVEWLKAQNLTSCYKQPAPTVYKTEVRKLISAGKEVPGCKIVEDQSVTLR